MTELGAADATGNDMGSREVRSHARFDADERTRVDIPAYDRCPAPSPSDGSQPAPEPTLLVRRRRPGRRSDADLGLAFLGGFALATVVVYLMMR